MARNHRHCDAGLKLLSEESGINYRNINRYARELAELGYIEYWQSPLDRRKRRYRLIYDDEFEGPSGDKLAPDQKDVINRDYKTNENVITELPQATDSKGVYKNNIIYKYKEKNHAEAVEQIDDVSTPTSAQVVGENAQQGTIGPLKHGYQGHQSRQIENRALKNQGGLNGQYWADWLSANKGMSTDESWLYLIAQIEEVKSEYDCTENEARRRLDQRLRSLRRRQ